MLTNIYVYQIIRINLKKKKSKFFRTLYKLQRSLSSLPNLRGRSRRRCGTMNLWKGRRLRGPVDSERKSDWLMNIKFGLQLLSAL